MREAPLHRLVQQQVVGLSRTVVQQGVDGEILVHLGLTQADGLQALDNGVRDLPPRLLLLAGRPLSKGR